MDLNDKCDLHMPTNRCLKYEKSIVIVPSSFINILTSVDNYK